MSLKSLPPALNTNQVSELTGYSPHTLAQRRSTGEGDMPPFVKLGTARSSRVVYTKRGLLEWMHRKGLIDAAELADALS